MEEKYYVVDNRTGLKGEALTWKQLLFWCAMSIGDYAQGRDPKTKKYGYFFRTSTNSHVTVINFFKNFAHCPGDGIHYEGYFPKVLDYQERIENVNRPGTYYYQAHYKEGEWIPPRFEPLKWRVVDNFDRTINSADIRKAYFAYAPNEEDKPPRKHRTKWVSRYSSNHSWEFRKDPVPNIRKYKNGYWHKYRGNHGHTNQELKQYHRDIIEQKEIIKEYGITFKIHRTWMDLDPWNHGHHCGTKGKGWKRSRKEKQWMKFGWKRPYEIKKYFGYDNLQCEFD